MDPQNRFTDENLSLSHFYNEVWVVCPSCGKKAVAKALVESKKIRLFCLHCGYNKEASTQLGPKAEITMPANQFFDAELWLQAPFSNDTFYAYNDKHLHYLERYISAGLREHKDRTHFTLLEKLPKFYHEAKNREGLLKIIARLNKKT